jgi:hypothetical protein
VTVRCDEHAGLLELPVAGVARLGRRDGREWTRMRVVSESVSIRVIRGQRVGEEDHEDTFRVPASLVAQNGPFTFQWQKNGVNIAGATGAYTVVAANAAGSATSNGAVLQVVESRK